MTIPTRYFSPVSCEDLRALFSKESLVPEECGVERLGAFRGHLSLCAQCQATYGARLEELVQQALAPKIVRGLGATMSVEVQQELLARLKDPDLCIRIAAVEALGSLGVVMPVPIQQALVARLVDPDWTVRMGAVQALSCLGAAMPVAVQEALVARLADCDLDVREAAKEALSLQGTVTPTAPKAVVEPRPDPIQQLVARTRDFLWSLCVPSPIPGLATMGKKQSTQSMVLEEEEAKRTTTSSSVELTKEEHVLSGPLLTGSGRFHLTLHGPESRLVGRDLCCKLQLMDGQTLFLRTSIHAATEASGWKATFDEPVLTDASLHAAADQQIPFDPAYLRLMVRPSQA